MSTEAPAGTRREPDEEEADREMNLIARKLENDSKTGLKNQFDLRAQNRQPRKCRYFKYKHWSPRSDSYVQLFASSARDPKRVCVDRVHKSGGQGGGL